MIKQNLNEMNDHEYAGALAALKREGLPHPDATPTPPLTAQPTHTPTPWDSGVTNDGIPFVCQLGGFDIGRLELSASRPQRLALADAAFIVKAVNSHDQLVAALRELLDCETNIAGCSGIKLLDAVDKARAALNAIEKGK